MKIRWLLVGVLLTVALVPALTITVARVAQPGGGVWVRLVAFTPYAVLLYLLALLLLLVVLAARRGFWRSVAALLCVVTVPLLALHVWWASPPYVGSSDAVGSEAAPFLVMAANLARGGADPLRVAEVAVGHDVDVLVLTEVTDDAWDRLRGGGVGRAFPHRAGKPASGVSGTMLLARHELSDVQTLDTTSGGLAATVDLPTGAVRALAVHPYFPFGEARKWRADHAAVRRAAAAADGPTVVAGDFNATIDHRPMRELRGRGFEDAADQVDAGWQPTWPAAGEVSFLGIGMPPLFAIDHVLLSDELVATEAETVTIKGTDHRALVVEVARR